MGPGELQHPRLDGGQVDGNLRIGRWHKARIILDVKKLARIVDRARGRAGPHGADAFHGLPHPGDRLAVGEPMPLLVPLRWGRPDPEHKPPPVYSATDMALISVCQG